jgi:hypothetical protein
VVVDLLGDEGHMMRELEAEADAVDFLERL